MTDPTQIPAGLTIRTATTADGDAVLNLVAEVLSEFGLFIEPTGIDSDLPDIEQSYLSPGGNFEVIEDADGKIVGSVGLFAISSDVCELRKMYLTPALRGAGLGKYLLERTVEEAKRRGFRTMILETSTKLEAANHLYQKFGFTKIFHEHPSRRADLAYQLALDS